MNHWKDGSQKEKLGKYSEALSAYQKIIKLMNEEKACDMKPDQSELLAKAYTLSSKILFVGSKKDKLMAQVYLKNALEIMPDLAMAIHLKKSIDSEEAISLIFKNISPAAPRGQQGQSL